MNELKEFILSKNKPVSSCKDLHKHFMGRHRVMPVYLTPKFEIEFEYIINKLDDLEKENQKYKEVINKIVDYINGLYDETDDMTCYAITEKAKKELLDILKEVNYE